MNELLRHCTIDLILSIIDRYIDIPFSDLTQILDSEHTIILHLKHSTFVIPFWHGGIIILSIFDTCDIIRFDGAILTVTVNKTLAQIDLIYGIKCLEVYD